MTEAEQKALEAYPNALTGNLDNLKKDGFIKGYNQAAQNFMKKAKAWFIQQHTGMFNSFKQYIEQQ